MKLFIANVPIESAGGYFTLFMKQINLFLFILLEIKCYFSSFWINSLPYCFLFLDLDILSTENYAVHLSEVMWSKNSTEDD